MVNNWIKVYKTGDSLRADLLLAELHDNDIETNFIDKLETVTKTSGVIEIYVQKKDEERARDIIDDIELTYEEE